MLSRSFLSGICILVGSMIGGILSPLVFAQAQKQNAEFAIVKAKAFDLVDNQDRVRATFHLRDNDPVLNFLDENGIVRIQVEVKGNAPKIELNDSNGSPLTNVSPGGMIVANKSHIQVTGVGVDSEGNGTIICFDNKGAISGSFPRNLETETLKTSRALTPNNDGWKDKANWRKLKKGMSMDEVKTLLGEPGKVSSMSNLTNWMYPDILGGSVTFNGERVWSWSEP